MGGEREEMAWKKIEIRKGHIEEKYWKGADKEDGERGREEHRDKVRDRGWREG